MTSGQRLKGGGVGRVYLDNNATTALDPRVVHAMQDFFLDAYGNPASRDHAFGWDAAEAVECARGEVAALVNATPHEITFTGSATESINCALKGLAPALSAEGRIVTCVTEHAAVLETSRQISRFRGVPLVMWPVDRTGHIDVAAAAEAVRSVPPGVIAIMAANNEIGTIHSLGAFARIAQESAAVFFSDLTQVVGRIPVDVRADGIDLAAFSAHKLHGPKGVGALYIRAGRGITLEPLIVGGSEERGLRAGTPNVPGIVGFGEACRIARMEMKDEAVRIGRLRDRLESALLADLPDIWVNGDPVNRLPNTTNIGFAGIDGRALIRDMHEIAVSTRSACSSSDERPSHVLKAVGLSDDDARACVRISFGRFNDENEVDYAIDKVRCSVRRLRRNTR